MLLFVPVMTLVAMEPNDYDFELQDEHLVCPELLRQQQEHHYVEPKPFTSQLLAERHPEDDHFDPHYVLPRGCISFGVKNDGTPEIVYVHDDYGNTVQETFYRYFCDLRATASDDDHTFNRYVKPAIFKQLCVQAAKVQNVDTKPFHELLTKIKKGTINPNANKVRMTEKDMNHRLLSYIPYGYVFALINDRKVEIMFETYTRFIGDPQEDEPLEKIDNDPEDSEFLFPEYREGRSYAGRNFELTGEKELAIIGYNFESDRVHHAAIVDSFTKLYKSLSGNYT